MFLKRVAGLLAIVVGLLGVLACLAGAYTVWRITTRLHDANEKVFTAVDKGLVFAQDRVRSVKKRVERAKITTTEIDQKVRDWAKQAAKERLTAQLEIDIAAEKLARHIVAADAWLETSADSVRNIQEVMALGNSLGASMDPASFDEMLDKIAALRTRVQEAEQTVDQIHDFGASKDDESSRLARITKLVARTVVTITDVDSLLDRSVNRLGELRTDAAELKGRIDNRITWGSIIGFVILAWIAAGQIALVWWGWSCWR
jgi:DNA repair ATPase RecN